MSDGRGRGAVVRADPGGDRGLNGAPSFGRLIRSRRRALDLTQEDLARQVGYSVITIRKVESDERKPSRQLAELLARNLLIAPEEQAAFTRMARTGLSAVEFLPGDGGGGLGAASGNLPEPLTRLIGRDSAVDAVRAAVLDRENRIVTLVGAPGIGKSTMAVRAAAGLRHAFPFGIFHVPLEPISDAALVPATVAKTVGLTDPGGQPLITALVSLLRERRLLLLLDNVEHLLDAAPAVAELLTACPGLAVLATSRAPLRIRGERLVPVLPLAAPRPSGAMTAAQAGGYPAVQLFVTRAEAADPDFRLTDANAADVARICTDLDGLPLAIELVAARSRMMSPHDLVARLGDRLTLLTGRPARPAAAPADPATHPGLELQPPGTGGAAAVRPPRGVRRWLHRAQRGACRQRVRRRTAERPGRAVRAG